MLEKGLIDFNAFVGKDKKLSIKELTIIDIDTYCLQHWIFKAPEKTYCDSSAVGHHNDWLSRHYHGLDFYSGYSSHDTIMSALNTICANIQLLYAPDDEKAQTLEKMFGSRRVVFSLERLGCPLHLRTPLMPQMDEEGNIITRDEGKCLYHRIHAPGFSCSKAHALRLAEWCLQNMELIDMNDPAVRVKTFDLWKVAAPSKKQLAEAGFVRILTTEDSTKCVYCGLSLHKWEQGDDPMTDHDFNSPLCKFLQLKMQERRQSGENTKKKPCCVNAACQDEYFLRYGTVPDVTEADVFKTCHA